MREDAGVDPDIGSFNVLISTLGRLKHISTALLVFEPELLAAKLWPPVTTFNALIHGCGIAGRPYVALKYFHDMSAYSAAASKVTYNTMLDVAVQYGESEIAAAVLREMHADPSVSLDSASATTPLTLYRANGQVEHARELMRSLHRERVLLDAATYGCCLTLLFEGGLEAEGVTVFG